MLPLVVGLGFIVAPAFGQDQDQAGLLLRLPARGGTVEASPGDLLVFSLESNRSTGPANPAAGLRVKIQGEGLASRPSVVYAPPRPPRPGEPGQIQAYIPVESAGEATVTITPVDGMGRAGKPVRFTVRVVLDAPAPE